MQYKPRDKLDDDPYGFLRTDVSKQHPIKGGGGGGGPRQIFWRIRFELWAPQVGETFGEVLGPRRPTVSEPHPAQKLA